MLGLNPVTGVDRRQFPADPAVVYIRSDDITKLWQDTAETVQVTTSGQNVQAVQDLSGRAHDGIQGSTPPTYLVNQVGQLGNTGTLLFDGTSGNLDFGTSLDFSVISRDWTVFLLVARRDITEDYTPVLASDVGGGGQDKWIIGFQNLLAGARGDPTLKNMSIFCYDGAGGHGEQWVTSNDFTSVQGEFWLWTIKKVGTTVSFYLNGKNFGTKSPIYIPTPAADLFAAYAEASVNGFIDLVLARLDGRALPDVTRQSIENAILATFKLPVVFRMDENTGTTTTDQAGAYPITLSGGYTWQTGTPAPVYGYTNPAYLRFDGTGSGTGSDAGLPTGAKTVTFWYRHEMLLGDHNFVSVAAYGTFSSTELVAVGFQTESTFSGSPVNQIAVTQYGSSVFTANLLPNDGLWHFVAVVFDGGSNWKIYSDGTLQASGTMTTSTVLSGALLLATGGTTSYAGDVDDLRIFPRALTNDDQARLMLGCNYPRVYHFEEASGTTTNDDLGGNALTLTNSGMWQQPGAPLPYSLYGLAFDGTVQAAGSDAGLPADSAPRTIALWFKSTVRDTYQGLIEYGSAGSGNEVALLFWNDNRMALATDAFQIVYWDVGVAGDSLWHHLAVSFDGTLWTLYLDGVSLGTRTVPTTTVVGSGLFIGSTNGTDNFFNGNIDEVRIYGAAIS